MDHLGNEKTLFLDFLNKFRGYIVDYVRRNSNSFVIYEHNVSQSPITLYKNQETAIRVIIKNQGLKPVYLSTDLKSKYILDINESLELYINKPLTIFCPEGETSIAFIES